MTAITFMRNYDASLDKSLQLMTAYNLKTGFLKMASSNEEIPIASRSFYG